MSLRNLALLLLVLFLSSCIDEKTLLQKFTPKEDDDLARHFVELVRTGNYDDAENMLDPAFQNAEGRKGLQDLHGVLDHGIPVSIDEFGCHTTQNLGSYGNKSSINLSYQIHFPSAWAIGNVEIQKLNGTATIISARFQPISDSLEVLNRFTLWGKTPLHYIILALCCLVPLYILWALIICIRTEVRHKWLWIIFILFGVGAVHLNWTTGAGNMQPFTILLPGASCQRNGSYAPWIFSVGFPLGALIFTLFKPRLTR